MGPVLFSVHKNVYVTRHKRVTRINLTGEVVSRENEFVYEFDMWHLSDRRQSGS